MAILGKPGLQIADLLQLPRQADRNLHQHGCYIDIVTNWATEIDGTYLDSATDKKGFIQRWLCYQQPSAAESKSRHLTAGYAYGRP